MRVVDNLYSQRMDNTEQASRYLAARAVRIAMVKRDATQTALATKMGVGQQWLSRRIGKNADVALDFDDIDRIAAALDVPITDLLPEATKSACVPSPSPSHPPLARTFKTTIAA